MKCDKQSMLLYVVTDRSWLGEAKLEQQVEDIIKAGATFLQLREKDLDFDRFVAEAKTIKQVTDRYRIPFVINDNVEVALAVGADGVHVGQSDLSAVTVRSHIGEDKILGVSAQTVEQALLAERSGADYIGVGAVFGSTTKMDANTVSRETLRQICHAVSIPIVAIGGINEQNMVELQGSGVHGVAVISAIFAAPDVSKATQKLLSLAKRIIG